MQVEMSYRDSSALPSLCLNTDDSFHTKGILAARLWLLAHRTVNACMSCRVLFSLVRGQDDFYLVQTSAHKHTRQHAHRPSCPLCFLLVAQPSVCAVLGCFHRHSHRLNAFVPRVRVSHTTTSGWTESSFGGAEYTTTILSSWLRRLEAWFPLR